MPPANAVLRRFVRQHSVPLSVDRRDSASSSSYGTGPSYSDLGTREIFVGGLNESMQPADAGENQSIRMVAYTTSDTDLQVNDRIDYNNRTLEVLSKEGKPNDLDVAIYRYELDDV